MKVLDKPAEAVATGEEAIPPRRRRRLHRRATMQVFFLSACSVAFLLLLLLPLAAIFWRSLPNGAIFTALRLPIVRDALRLSLITTAAVVLAQCFVAAPFYIKAAKAGFAGVDRELEMVAETFGSSGWYTFTRITLPLAFPSVLGGMVMMWSRALGEFGATIFFAGNRQSITQTIPLAIFQEEQASHFDTALAMSAVLVCVSFAILVTVKWLTSRLLVSDDDTLRPIARR